MFHEHRYQQSIKEGIQYCKLCGALAFNSEPGQVIPSLNALADMNIDPLRLKFHPATTVVDYRNQDNINYLRKRNLGLQRIKKLMDEYHLKRLVYYKAISFMNRIYLSCSPPLEEVENIGAMCLLLAMEFNQCCNKKDTSDNPSQLEKTSELKGFYQEVKKSMKNFKEIELICLKCLNYDLGRYSAYDYLTLFFRLGFIFGGPELNMEKEFEKCINLLDLITKSSKSCDFSQYILAMSIIKTNFRANKSFDENTFKYIYGVDLSKQKYMACINVLDYVIENHCRKSKKSNAITGLNTDNINNTKRNSKYVINSNERQQNWTKNYCINYEFNMANQLALINNIQNINNIASNIINYSFYNQTNPNLQLNSYYFICNNQVHDVKTLIDNII